MWDKLASILGWSIFQGVSDIISKFVPDPTKQAEIAAQLAVLESNARTKALELEAQDRNSARQREMTVRDHTPAVLAYLITLGFFSILTWMLTHDMPQTGHDALLVMLGSLGTAWAAVVGYYYGSSSGSERKTELLGKK